MYFELNSQKKKMKLYRIIIFLCFFYQVALAQEKSILFSHLSSNNGLSGITINCILKDKYGFLWFGTENGLNKYDGNKFKVFRKKPGDSKTIPHSQITCLLEDKAGELWVGTLGGGLAKYNREDDLHLMEEEQSILSLKVPMAIFGWALFTDFKFLKGKLKR
jgi:ligand-binding sensor domain-containing protein